MGIKIKNLDHAIIELRSPGTLTAATNKDVVQIPFNGFIINITGRLSSAGTGVTSTVADVHLAGTTIFGGAGKLTFVATTGVTATVATFTTDPVAVTAGQLLTLDVDSISTAPANLCVTMVLSRRPSAATGTLHDVSPLY